MNRCNDPTCPLTRQGITHENHKLIESKPITDPCEDSRCGLNRIGLRHNVHDHIETDDEPKRKKFNDEDTTQDDYNYDDNNNNDDDNDDNNDDDNNDDVDYNDLLDELGKQIHNDHKPPEEQVISERTKRERQKIEQEAQEEIKKRGKSKSNPKEKTSTKATTSSRSNNDSMIPSITQILSITDPYKMFNVTQYTTCTEIKARFKRLSKSYNASRGSANRTREEQQLLTHAQSKINLAYDFLRKRHCI